MSPLWLSCCVARDADYCIVKFPSVLPLSRDDAKGIEEDLAFFDCAETAQELMDLWEDSLVVARAVAQGQEAQGLSTGRPDCCGDLATDLAAARAVLERTREEWSKRVCELARGGPEMEWADLSAARRMLRANNVDVPKAVEMFLQALEFRARYRELFQTLHCEAPCDIRILARDKEEHPVIYMCAQSLVTPLRTIRDQFMVTFEAACRLTTKEGKVVFVVDMHGLRPHLVLDFGAVKDLSDTLGTVFAERIARIIIVDFSRAAQAAWWMLKPMLTQKTRDKFAFVSNSRARAISSQILSEADHKNLCDTFSINRNRRSSAAERALHARRTTMCDVPLGPPLK